MRTIPTTHRYAAAFWNAMKNREADKTDLNERRGYGHELVAPTEFEQKIREELENHNIFRKLASIVETDSTSCTIRAILPFGEAAFVDEGASILEENAEDMHLGVKSHKIAKLVKLTNEFRGDAGFDLQSALASEFGRAFGKAEENACVNGDGTSQPYGILHADEGAETGVMSASAGEIAFDEIVRLYFSLDAEYRRNAVWIMSDETAMALRVLKDSAGNYLWRSADDSIFSRPALTSPYMPSVSAGAKPVLFGDFKYYWLIERGGVMVQPMLEKYAPVGLTGYIGSERVDGRLVKREAVKVLRMAE